MARFPLLLLTLTLYAASGCTPWNVADEEKKPWQLPAPRMSPNTVVIEVAFVRLGSESPEAVDQIWQNVDEQVVANELRRKLNDNGLRCGTIGTHLPDVIQRLLAPVDDPLAMATQDPEKLPDDITSRQHRLQSREGVRTPIAASVDIPSLHVLVNEDGSVRGETFQLAQCMFGLRTYPKGDGRVQLEVTPEIEYGEPRNRRVGREGIWRLEYGRDRKSFEALKVEALLSPGEVFVISATPAAVGLGQSFFVKGPEERTMLLVRLAQVQKDHLFEAAESEL